MNFSRKMSFAAIAASATASMFAAGGSEADKPQGFRFFDNHLVIKPYVSLAYTFDSNIDSVKHATDDSVFLVSPAADIIWTGDTWMLTGNIWYRYNYYCHYNDDMGENSYGESLSYKWTTSKPGEKGWSALIFERYAYTSQSDDLGGDGRGSDNVRGVWRDRETITVSGALERRFNDRLHADVSGQYRYLDYVNNTTKYYPLYGWSQYSIGLEAGYAASKWTDLLVAGGYSHYHQHGSRTTTRHYSTGSESYTVMGGVGTHATEKIQYRLLAGASWLSYGGHSGSDCGWTYQVSGNWRITRQLQWSALGSSYYQPSERSLGSAMKVSTLSTGLSYLTLGDRLTLTANIAFRHEENVYHDSIIGAASDYDTEFLSAAIGANYTLNRWMSFYGRLTYEQEWNSKHNNYEYDRFRGTLGVRFHY